MSKVSYKAWSLLFESGKKYQINKDRYLLFEEARKAFRGEAIIRLSEDPVEEDNDSFKKILNQNSVQLLNRFDSLIQQEKRLLKHCLSHIINLSNPELAALFQQQMPQLYIQNLSEEEVTYETVKNELKITGSLSTSLTLNDEISFLEQMKQTFNAIFINMASSRKRKRHAECTNVDKATNLLDLVIGADDLYTEPGETTSNATKMVRVANEHFSGWSSGSTSSTSNLGGRKTDILLMGNDEISKINGQSRRKIFVSLTKDKWH
ncbi:uncharacterized protein B0P05DRAFT_634114 [Gilbertella persicaria]|uniref:uncharacterized protein n=1 Tax=Gilbertella persicaria TaxID=101096 RepID=UPI00221E8005|nr:uncharacterized protein B0P05DRAFT_634114 [Gilbertella persicaria]KAI8092221.1 hypothetical protein B0P05DRAFT_634114 [Gilbertella persicaria]